MSSADIARIDDLVREFYQMTTEIIIQGRRAAVTFSDAIAGDCLDQHDFVTRNLRPWKKSLTRPLYIDVILKDFEGREYLIEKWSIVYQRKDDNRDNRYSTATKRKVVLIRTLYCLVRLMPGFQLLTQTVNVCDLRVKMYNPENVDSTTFSCDPSTHDIPKLNTSKGIVHLNVKYLSSQQLQRIMLLEQHSRANSSAMPISSLQGPGPGQPRRSHSLDMPSPSSATATATATASPDNRDRIGAASSPISSKTTQVGSSNNAGLLGLLSSSAKKSSIPIPMKPPASKHSYLISNNSNNNSGIKVGSNSSSPFASKPVSGSSPSNYSPAFLVDFFLGSSPGGTAITSQNIESNTGGIGGGGGGGGSLIGAASISPPFKQSSPSLLSTSPHVTVGADGLLSRMNNARGVPAATAAASHLRANKTTSEVAELNVDLNILLPPSPFDPPPVSVLSCSPGSAVSGGGLPSCDRPQSGRRDKRRSFSTGGSCMFAMADEDDINNCINNNTLDNNLNAKEDGENVHNLLNRSRSNSSVDTDGGDELLRADEDMPFAMAQSEHVDTFRLSSDNTITQQFVVPRDLTSFATYMYQMQSPPRERGTRNNKPQMELFRERIDSINEFRANYINTITGQTT